MTAGKVYIVVIALAQLETWKNADFEKDSK